MIDSAAGHAPPLSDRRPIGVLGGRHLHGRDGNDGVRGDPVIRQRVAAYAVVVSDRGLLATEYSDRTAVAERWGMPGGGIDDHEEPDEAVLREVAEETSQRSNSASLIKIQTSHWIGRSPRAEIEDFHADPVDLPRHLPRSDGAGGRRSRRHDRIGSLGAAP